MLHVAGLSTLPRDRVHMAQSTNLSRENQRGPLSQLALVIIEYLPCSDQIAYNGASERAPLSPLAFQPQQKLSQRHFPEFLPGVRDGGL